jgi:hypothetical protein
MFLKLKNLESYLCKYPVEYLEVKHGLFTILKKKKGFPAETSWFSASYSYYNFLL